ncbi:dihydroxy-acid dehydratase [Chitinophaga flava]|uniref:Dihydroxy-acid dehydratase n=2 Tax=Chitinophaga flava TaxID=2259036 RepID=A0A365XYD0_9BACT|nr:dihydroxy-acid dehydratase [Chitinophaga flava]
MIAAAVSCKKNNGEVTTSSASQQQTAVEQLSASPLYPGYNTSPQPPDASGMSSTAQQLAAKIRIGWNIGNTLDAIGGETAWGNPKVTNDLVRMVKQAGFNAIRIPCSWNQYSDAKTAKIQDAWLNRVKEVVQYCVSNDMYVILNVHWDGGWLENNCTPEKKDSVNAKQKAFWEQIATSLRGFDEHLLFASANEPNVGDATQMNVLLSYHQTFVDAVRSTGGRNAYRTLVVQGPSTDIDKTVQLMTKLPADRVPNKMMVEVHAYTPYQFALMTKDETWGKQFFYWGMGYHSTTDPDHNATWGEEAEIDRLYKFLKSAFVDKGFPVVLGEFGAIRRTALTGDNLRLHLASRAYHLKYVVKQCKTNGVLPFYWDEGALGNNSFGIFDRRSNTVFDRQALDSLLRGLN